MSVPWLMEGAPSVPYAVGVTGVSHLPVAGLPVPPILSFQEHTHRGPGFDMADDQSRAELNRLYWESDESVAGIADRLDISRRALYDSIEPRPAGAPCPQCGTALVFRNRMALENRQAECPECGHEQTVEATAPEPVDRPEPRRRDGTPEPIGRPPIRRLPQSGGGAGLGVALVAGLALGAATAYLLKRH
jgi:Zn ribbon nucleic-acid-binding protein